MLLEKGADPNIGDEFTNVNTTARQLYMNPLQGLGNSILLLLGFD